MRFAKIQEDGRSNRRERRMAVDKNLDSQEDSEEQTLTPPHKIRWWSSLWCIFHPAVFHMFPVTGLLLAVRTNEAFSLLCPRNTGPALNFFFGASFGTKCCLLLNGTHPCLLSLNAPMFVVWVQSCAIFLQVHNLQYLFVHLLAHLLVHLLVYPSIAILAALPSHNPWNMSLSQLSLIMSHSFPFFRDFPMCLHHFARMFSIFVHILYVW